MLEAVMICLDNSEYMRNGDYSPDRLYSETESISHVCREKINDNMETTVGFLCMAPRVEVFTNLCADMGKIMTRLQSVKVSGKSDFAAGLKTAQLALKNRQNKNQRQRVIMYVGSPIELDAKELVKLGKNFKKNNVAVDVVNFGLENETNDNVEKLQAFIDAVNSSDNSHLVTVTAEKNVILSSAVLSSPIMASSASQSAFAQSAAVSAGGASHEDTGGVDPNMDPELAMVLRMSMEEERQRQDNVAKAAGKAVPAAAAAAGSSAMSVEESEEETLLKAIAMSMEMDTDTASVSAPSTPAPGKAAATPAAPSKQTKAEEQADVDIAEALKDPDFLMSLLDSVPGLDREEIALDDILNKLTEDDADKDKDKKKNDKKK